MDKYLRKAANKTEFTDLDVVDAHRGSVSAVCFGKKSSQIFATGGSDCDVNIWTLKQADPLVCLTGHPSDILSLSFNTADSIIVAGCMSAITKIWDLSTSRAIATLNGHKSSITCVDVHLHGYVASGSMDSTIKVWDPRTKACLITYKGHSKTVTSLQFSPDGRWLVSGGNDNKAMLWDLAAGKPLSEFSDHRAAIKRVAFHPEELVMATASKDRTVILWDLESFGSIAKSTSADSDIENIRFHPSGECLYAVSQRTLHVHGWEPYTLYESVACEWTNSYALSFLDSQLLCASVEDSSVVVHNVDTTLLRPFVRENEDHVAPSTEFAVNVYVAKPETNNMITPVSTRQHVSEYGVKAAHNLPASAQCSIVQETSPPNFEYDYEAGFQPRRTISRSPVKKLSCENSETEASFPICQPHYIAQSDKRSNTTSGQNRIRPLQNKPVAAVSSVQDTSRTSDAVVALARLSLADNANPSLKMADSATISVYPLTSSCSVSEKPNVTIAAVPPAPRKISDDPSFSQRSAVECCSTPFDESIGITPMFSGSIYSSNQLPPREHLAVPPCAAPSSRLTSETTTAALQNNDDILRLISRGSSTVVQTLEQRAKAHELIRSLWSPRNPKAALDYAVGQGERPLVVDLLGMMNNKKSSPWSLDSCLYLLPDIKMMLDSKHESYVQVSCESLKMILRGLSAVIKDGLQSAALPEIGVDISREERTRKCRVCYNELLSIRELLESKYKFSPFSSKFKELLLLLNMLDR